MNDDDIIRIKSDNFCLKYELDKLRDSRRFEAAIAAMEGTLAGGRVLAGANELAIYSVSFADALLAALAPQEPTT